MAIVLYFSLKPVNTLGIVLIFANFWREIEFENSSKNPASIIFQKNPASSIFQRLREAVVLTGQHVEGYSVFVHRLYLWFVLPFHYLKF
jgi:hypothetical protein